MPTDKPSGYEHDIDSQLVSTEKRFPWFTNKTKLNLLKFCIFRDLKASYKSFLVSTVHGSFKAYPHSIDLGIRAH